MANAETKTPMQAGLAAVPVATGAILVPEAYDLLAYVAAYEARDGAGRVTSAGWRPYADVAARWGPSLVQAAIVLGVLRVLRWTDDEAGRSIEVVGVTDLGRRALAR